jgi:EAL domain-containing protein (putative c-di-GMP-specific phosphodiesterase class I)
MEALARWNHPDDGARSPADFVPLAEETGLIVPLGDLVLRQALRTAAQIEGLSLAVNISPVQIDRAEFPDRLAALIAESGFNPARLELEITETALMSGRERAVEALARFRALGVKIALDDFGTGYSSFEYLRSYPVDRIKIDQSFVRSAATDPSSREIVRAIITLGHGLGMSITAEGIETEAQFRAMVEAGCDRFQGFLFSPPVPSAVMIGFAAGEPLPVGRRRVRIASGAA